MCVLHVSFGRYRVRTNSLNWISLFIFYRVSVSARFITWACPLCPRVFLWCRGRLHSLRSLLCSWGISLVVNQVGSCETTIQLVLCSYQHETIVQLLIKWLTLPKPLSFSVIIHLCSNFSRMLRSMTYWDYAIGVRTRITVFAPR